MFRPNTDALFSAIRPRRESALNEGHTIDYVVNRQRIVKRETGRIMAEREILSTHAAPSYALDQDDTDGNEATRARVADVAGAIGGFSIRYGTADGHVSAMARYADGFRSIAPDYHALIGAEALTDGPYLSDYAYSTTHGLYYVSEASARNEEAKRNRAAAAARTTGKRTRAGRKTTPCTEDGRVCVDNEESKRVHGTTGKERARCRSRLAMSAKRERDAAIANAREDARDTTASVASAVATSSTSWDIDH